MPTIFKTVNLDLSKIERVKMNLKLRAACPECSAEMVHDFKAEPLTYPVEKQRMPVDFACPACASRFHVPAQIVNMRLVLAYDAAKIKKIP